MKQVNFFLAFLFISFAAWSQSAKTESWIGESTGELPFLEYSNGKVRLGADKIGFIDTAVRLVVIDSVEDRYKVKLAQNWSAYIPKSSVAPVDSSLLSDEESSDEYPYISGSWHLAGKEKYDLLSIRFPARLPYRSYQTADPNKITIDVFGAVSNTTWVTQLRSAKIVKNIYQEQVENDVYRIHVELDGKQNWGYRVGYSGSVLQVKVKHPPAKKGIKNLFIAIDAGHGGSATGTSSPSGTLEKEYTLEFALELQKLLLRKGVRHVHMTRTADLDIPTPDRVLNLQEVDPDVLISLHLNSSSNPDVSGVSTYYKHMGGKKLSENILDEMLKLGLNEFGLIGNFNFLLNSPIEYPNTLVEIAFLSNPDDEKRVLDPKFHKQTAKQIFKGLKTWLKEVQK